MTTTLYRRSVCVSAVALALLSTPLAAQQSRGAAPAGINAALASDVGTLSDKFVGLARVMAGKYDWKPGTGVRSVADVLNLIVMENKMLTGTLTGAAAPAGAPTAITDPAQMQDALKTSYASLRQALAGLSQSDLQASVKFFGQDTTKQGAALMLIFDQHGISGSRSRIRPPTASCRLGASKKFCYCDLALNTLTVLSSGWRHRSMASKKKQPKKSVARARVSKTGSAPDEQARLRRRPQVHAD